MLQQTLIKLYERDLGKLREEIEQYSDEADLWRTRGEIANSAGNLALHLVGNLNHFFGAVLGGSGYVRDRDAEFARSGVSKQELLAQIEEAIPGVINTLKDLPDEDLAKTYPIEVFGHPMTTEYFLVHLATHFNYHLGQINYHRRLLTGGDFE
ncbi:MAG TPA: DinB family protein [Pyrinomonadaceae bacterium]|nr:DinB family protein [Pyrinomonadaceae bacterium]